MSVPGELQRTFLLRVARKALIDRGFEVDFLPEVFAEIRRLSPSAASNARGRAACRSEWRLIAATHNLLKLHRSRCSAVTA